jgi:hypothetical protein
MVERYLESSMSLESNYCTSMVIPKGVDITGKTEADQGFMNIGCFKFLVHEQNPMQFY